MIFIAIDSFCYADGKVDKIQKGMWTLRNEPNLGKMATENNNFTLRELAAGNYRVIYEVKSEYIYGWQLLWGNFCK